MLHARGDVSKPDNGFLGDFAYAPRTWRCFQSYEVIYNPIRVCSTHVEMFLVHGLD